MPIRSLGQLRNFTAIEMTKKIIVASKNPVKIEASLNAFKEVFPSEKFNVEGASVPSGVSDQPMSDRKTYKGALNRAQNGKKKFPKGKFWVGIEGGIEKRGDKMITFAWVVVLSEGIIGKGRSTSFFLPKKVTKLIEEGKELGEANDIVFGKSNSKQKNGAIGLLTGNVITRTTLYEPAIIAALIPFKNRKFDF